MSTETKSPGTLASDNAVGTVAWSNPSNAATSNDVRATSSLTVGQTSQYLKATNFGFAIPSGATIDGIVVNIEKNGGVFGAQSGIEDNTVKLVVGGAVVGTNKGNTSTDWPLTDDVVVYGSSSDLWGITPTDSDINGSTFGVVIAGDCVDQDTVAAVDHIEITVHYTYTPPPFVPTVIVF